MGRAPNIRFRCSFKQKMSKGYGFLVDTVNVEQFLKDFEHFPSMWVIGTKNTFE